MLAIFNFKKSLTMLKLQFTGSINEIYLSVYNKCHAITKCIGHMHIMGGDADGRPLFLFSQNQGFNLSQVDRIQSRGRFIKKNQTGVVQETPTKVQADLHPL